MSRNVDFRPGALGLGASGLAVLAFATLTPGGTLAEGLTSPQDPWSGFSIGVYAGANFSDGTLVPDQGLQDRYEDPGIAPTDNFLTETDNRLQSTDPDFDFLNSGTDTGFVGGATLGLSQRIGNFVIGIEGDIGGTSVEKSVNRSVVDPQADYDTTGADIDIDTANREQTFRSKFEQTAEAAIKIRAGILLTETVLLYASGGYAATKVKSSLSYQAITEYDDDDVGTGVDITHTSTARDSWDGWESGYTVGGGVEALLGDGWSIGLDYRFSDYGDFNRTMDVTRTSDSVELPNNQSEGDDPTTVRVSQSLENHAVTARLRYQFGWN